MKKIFTLVLSVFTVAALSAQTPEEGWVRGGVFGVNLSQASFSNWAAGGDNSIAFDAVFNYSLNYKRDKHLWTNRLELAYGLNNTQSYDSVRKTNDKIYFSSNYGYKIAENLYIGALVTFNTQFAKGYDYKVSSTDYISTFMAPGYLTTGVGLIWTPRPWLKVTFNPASWRATFVYDEYLSNLPGGSYGVAQGENILNQFGANLVTEVNKEIWENVNLYSRLELYSNYLSKPQNIIVHWDTQLNFKINRWLSAGLNFNMIYDDNIRFNDGEGRTVPKMQIKQTLGIGLQVQF